MTIPVLENERAKLMPLSLENCRYLLAISGEKGLLQYSPSDISTYPKLIKYVEQALEQAAAGKAMPFIIFDKKSGKYAGSTRFGEIDHLNKVLHIGWTWLGAEFRGTGLNQEVKSLMLNYAFRELKFEKVEFRIDERNLRSRRATEKLGAKLEGILRRNVYLPDGFKRNTCCYGILAEEWPTRNNSRK